MRNENVFERFMPPGQHFFNPPPSPRKSNILKFKVRLFCYRQCWPKENLINCLCYSCNIVRNYYYVRAKFKLNPFSSLIMAGFGRTSKQTFAFIIWVGFVNTNMYVFVKFITIGDHTKVKGNINLSFLVMSQISRKINVT